MNRDFWLFDKNKSRLVHNWFLQFNHFRYLHIITTNKWFLCGVLGNFKILRVDFNWRGNYLDRPEVKKFAVKFGIQVVF